MEGNGSSGLVTPYRAFIDPLQTVMTGHYPVMSWDSRGMPQENPDITVGNPSTTVVYAISDPQSQPWTSEGITCQAREGGQRQSERGFEVGGKPQAALGGTAQAQPTGSTVLTGQSTATSSSMSRESRDSGMSQENRGMSAEVPVSTVFFAMPSPQEMGDLQMTVWGEGPQTATEGEREEQGGRSQSGSRQSRGGARGVSEQDQDMPQSFLSHMTAAQEGGITTPTTRAAKAAASTHLGMPLPASLDLGEAAVETTSDREGAGEWSDGECLHSPASYSTIPDEDWDENEKMWGVKGEKPFEEWPTPQNHLEVRRDTEILAANFRELHKVEELWGPCEGIHNIGLPEHFKTSVLALQEPEGGVQGEPSLQGTMCVIDACVGDPVFVFYWAHTHVPYDQVPEILANCKFSVEDHCRFWMNQVKEAIFSMWSNPKFVREPVPMNEMDAKYAHYLNKLPRVLPFPKIIPPPLTWEMPPPLVILGQGLR